MRKACMAGIGVLIGISMLAGCGKSLNADTDTVYVQKNGTVLTVDVETLDKDYYDETLAGWQGEHTWTVNDKVWESVSFDNLFTTTVESTESAGDTEAVTATEE